jgi:hypothetical protein|tara:strand:- start:244 stop:489 length:246 start_codon:yes stop_codon:yes gene_type:complete
MPQGVSGAYKSGYIMGQMSKQGAMNEANESSLHREALDGSIAGANAGTINGPFQSTQDSKSVSANQTGALGTVMGASKYTP